MAIDIFLKVEGIDGESVDSVHTDEIDILGWNWNLIQTGTTHDGLGGGAGQVEVANLSVTKYIDKSSGVLAQKCCTGEHIPECVLTLRKAGGEPLDYLVITMKDCLVSALSHAGDESDDRSREILDWNFAEYTWAYTPQNADGSGGAVIESSFNIAQNVIP